MVDFFQIALEESRAFAPYQEMVRRYRAAVGSAMPRWPIFRFYSSEHFIGNERDYDFLAKIDPDTYELLTEDRSILDRIKFLWPLKSCMMISTNMGSRLVIADDYINQIASVDFHGKSAAFSDFESFFRAEIKLEIQMAAREPFVCALIECFDCNAIAALPFG